jgi:hypothetical protein
MHRANALGQLALAMAASSAIFSAVIASTTIVRGSVFCSSTACFVEGVLWSLPGYAAMLAIVMTAILIASTLVRSHIGPSLVRIVALGGAIVGAVAYVVASLISLDAAWAGAFSGQLTPHPGPLVPPALVPLTPALWAISFMSIGVWMALTSLLTLRLHVPPPLVVFGWVTGVALVAFIPVMTFARDYTVSTYALPAEFLAITVWALFLGVVLIRRPLRAG